MKYQRHERSVYYLEWYIWVAEVIVVIVLVVVVMVVVVGVMERRKENNLVSILLDVLIPSFLYFVC